MTLEEEMGVTMDLAVLSLERMYCLNQSKCIDFALDKHGVNILLAALKRCEYLRWYWVNRVGKTTT